MMGEVTICIWREREGPCVCLHPHIYFVAKLLPPSLFLQKVSPFERQIQRDLTRTFPEHSFFKDRDGLGQESLLNVMKVRGESEGGRKEEGRGGEEGGRDGGRKGGSDGGRKGGRKGKECCRTNFVVIENFRSKR